MRPLAIPLPLYDNMRTRLLPAQPTIHNTLYGSTAQRTAITLPTVRQHENQASASSTNNTQHAIWIHRTTNSHNIAHCTITSEPDYCHLNQQYTTRYMDPPHNEQPQHCPLYDNIRTRLLPAQPTIHNTLYGSTTQRTAITLPTERQHENQATASSTNNTQHAIWIHHTTNSHNIAHCTTT